VIDRKMRSKSFEKSLVLILRGLIKKSSMAETIKKKLASKGGTKTNYKHCEGKGPHVKIK